MIKNYFILNRIILEANEELDGFRITEAYSQEKDKIIFCFKRNDDEKFIEISVNPGFPYINLRQNVHRAKKNTVDFFSEYLPAEFVSFEIADNDRVLKLNLSTKTLYFTIRGKYTNVFLIDEDKIIPFKKISDEENDLLIDEITKINFIHHFNIPEIKIDYSDFKSGIKNSYPFIGKEILKEVETRVAEESIPQKIEALKKILNEINLESPVVLINEDESTVNLAVKTFRSFSFTKREVFDSLIRAVNFFISKKFSIQSSFSKEKIIQKHLDRELKKIVEKLNNLKARINKGSRETEYKSIAELLLINLNKLYKGMSEIELEDMLNPGTQIKVKLDPKLSPQKNVEMYFDKSKNERTNFEKSIQLFDSVKKEYDKLNRIQTELKTIDSNEKLMLIMKELKIKNEASKQGSENDLSSKFKQYIINGKYRLYVGKDSRNNDLLTTKFARQNDFWFHARSVSGSH